MTLKRTDYLSLDLTASLDSAGQLVLSHEQVLLSAHDNSLLHQLSDLSQAALTVSDFVHGGVRYEVHAWEEQPDGKFSNPWTREVDRVTSGVRSEFEAVVIFVAVPEGLTPPIPEPLEGPPSPGKSVLKVKVQAKGSMPIGS